MTYKGKSHTGTAEYMDSSAIGVNFLPSSVTFETVPGFSTAWTIPERRLNGVYLWCIEYEDAFLVNYVGKTFSKSGFEGRLWTEFKDWQAGLYCKPVDIAAFKQGKRVILEEYP